MSEIKVFTDSTSDLSKEIINEFNITIVPLYVNFGNQVYKDTIDINTDKLYKKVKDTQELPKTSAPSPSNFYNYFKPYVDQGKDIIYIGISSHLSSTIQNAKLASLEFDEVNIEIIDSQNLSTGIGLLVMKAVKLIEQGLNVKEVSKAIKEYIPKVRTGFIIDTLDYLYKGGRCSALQSFIGGMLKIRPLVKVVNGEMILGQKTRGKRTKALDILLKNIYQDKGIIDADYVFITHSKAYNDAIFIKETLEKNIAADNIIITNAGCVISSHCGPNTIGILYIVK
ncbi:DegV family protein [Sporosalibacterium faouarense]|uniref:DegV family protein n=1 Tax=Sporosalibacterium faouarense TaxID=516123 RepID=UPI00141C1CDE|nr:DegV family protein [Sporosalibacterium faouarense]MTI49592.1 DegV family protein [Bacillota bacterium]